MKPIRQFINQSMNMRRTLRYLDYLAFIEVNGYTCLIVKDIRYFLVYNDWCHIHYPNDFYSINEQMFFTNKEIPILMKLSVVL